MRLNPQVVRIVLTALLRFSRHSRQRRQNAQFTFNNHRRYCYFSIYNANFIGRYRVKLKDIKSFPTYVKFNIISKYEGILVGINNNIAIFSPLLNLDTQVERLNPFISSEFDVLEYEYLEVNPLYTSLDMADKSKPLYQGQKADGSCGCDWLIVLQSGCKCGGK